MANSAQARKRARQDEKRRLLNHSQKSTMRTVLKKTLALIKSGEKEAATLAFKKTVKLIDHLCGHGMLHSNRAARLKSRLNKKLRA